MFSTVCFTNGWFTEFDVLQTDGDVVIDDVEFDVTAFIVVDFFIGSNTDVANDFFHTRDGVVA